MLESAALRAFQTAGGEDVYPSLVEKAAALFHSLVSNHPFVNGNKRTAVLAVDHFLLANGSFLALSNEEMYELATETATYREKRITHQHILQRITDRVGSLTVALSYLRRRGFFLIYRSALEARRSIRSDKLNAAQPFQR
ncbi:MAG: type II toxin-antitoxin system death-on-curing family toxin [Candidatus Acidiferrales bacterium]